MDQDTTWYGGRPQPGDIVLYRNPAPHRKGAQQPPPYLSAHVYCGQTVAHLSNCCALILFMAVHSNGYAIIFCSCGYFLYFLFLSSFFFAYSQRSEIGCLPFFHTWCGLSVQKKIEKNHNLGTIAQLCWAVSSQLKNVSITGKNLLNSNSPPHVFTKYCENRPINGWDRFRSLEHPSKF